MRSDARKRIAEEFTYEVDFRRYAEASGQVLCPDPGRPCECDESIANHTVFPILNIPCDGCRATL